MTTEKQLICAFIALLSISFLLIGVVNTIALLTVISLSVFGIMWFLKPWWSEE